MIRFCPHCGTTLIQKMDGGRLRPTCPMGDYIPGAPGTGRIDKGWINARN